MGLPTNNKTDYYPNPLFNKGNISIGEFKTIDDCMNHPLRGTWCINRDEDNLFEKYTNSFTLTRVRTTNMGTLYELTYEILMKKDVSQKDFMDEIRCRNGNLNISIAIMENNNPQL